MCAFFARPNLDNTQFKQLKGGEPLTLSGQTQIATLSGLTLATGDTTGTGVIITASGASSAMNNYVLTYDHLDNKIKLKESSASGGTGYYDGASPTTCTVGGLSATTEICNCSIVDIIECMVSPTVPPDLTNVSISALTLIPSTTLYEAGCQLCLCARVSFSVGCIDPYYQGVPPFTAINRSCGVSGYTFSYQGCGGTFTCSSAPTGGTDFGTVGINLDSNSVVGCVSYCCGAQPYKSDTITTFDTPLDAGFCLSNDTITGVYPWYWGTVSCAGAAGFGRPDADCIKHEMTGNTCGGTSGGSKCVGMSNGTLSVNFNSTSDDYLWFAIPVSGGTDKHCWCQSALNKGCIGGTPTSYPSVGVNLFPDPQIINCVTSVGTGSWSGQSYSVYISNYQTCLTSYIQLRNS